MDAERRKASCKPVADTLSEPDADANTGAKSYADAIPDPYRSFRSIQSCAAGAREPGQAVSRADQPAT